MTRTYEVMKLEASSYLTTVDVVPSEFVSEHASPTIGKVADPVRAVFAAFLVLFLILIFFWFFDCPPPTAGDGDDLVIPLAEDL
jgi:hypothetical protein